MRSDINQRKSAREYDEFVRHKVERARTSMRAGNGILQETIEAQAAVRQEELLRQAVEIDLYRLSEHRKPITIV